MMTREACIARDRKDHLAPLRASFHIPEGCIYLDGNSLGMQPKAALTRAQQLITQEWGTDLIGSWNKAGWFDMPSRLGDKLAPLIGAENGEVVVTDSTSINLFKALAAALKMQDSDPQRKIILTERGNFPTDIYMGESMAAWLGHRHTLQMVDTPDELMAAIDSHTAVVVLTHINYRTGYQHDMQAITRYAHDRGALVIWDLAHSAGAVPVDLNSCKVDMAIGCTYKYLNGGPGSPAFIWIPKRHQATFVQPLSGWWAHANPFAMAPKFEPVDGIRRALCGTQPILSLAMVECGLEVFAQTDMQTIRDKSLALTDLFIELVEQHCPQHPLALATPRTHAERGSQVSYRHPHGYAVMQALIGRGVIGDYREPSIMRFGFTPLYTRFVDVWDAVQILKDILDRRQFDISIERTTVT